MGILNQLSEILKYEKWSALKIYLQSPITNVHWKLKKIIADAGNQS